MSRATHSLASGRDGRSSSSVGRKLLRQSKQFNYCCEVNEPLNMYLEKMELCFVLVQFGLLYNLRKRGQNKNCGFVEYYFVLSWHRK